VTLEFGADREAVRLAIEKENIESQPIWKSMHLQPVFEITPGARGIAHSDSKRHEARVVGGEEQQVTDEDLERGVNVFKYCYKLARF
jgi:hypothetical protein